jgi:hypothetical protein
MVDGKWPREVRVSIFNGGDAIHMNGAIQPLIMKELPYLKDNGQPMYSPATTHAWEEALWEKRLKLQDHPGLKWDLDPRREGRGNSEKPAEGSGRAALLSKLGGFIEQEVSDDSAVMVLDYRDVDSTYDGLKIRGTKKEATAKTVYVLLGGAHGFNGKDDKDSKFFNEILALFKSRVGNRLARVNLCEGEDDTAKFTASSVAAFLAVEYHRGTLGHAVSGLEDLFAPRPPQPKLAPWASRQSGSQDRAQAAQEVKPDIKELEKLQRENAELLAELKVLRTSALERAEDNISLRSLSTGASVINGKVPQESIASCPISRASSRSSSPGAPLDNDVTTAFSTFPPQSSLPATTQCPGLSLNDGVTVALSTSLQQSSVPASTTVMDDTEFPSLTNTTVRSKRPNRGRR